jgi:hypothetical protein
LSAEVLESFPLWQTRSSVLSNFITMKVLLTLEGESGAVGGLYWLVSNYLNVNVF